MDEELRRRMRQKGYSDKQIDKAEDTLMKVGLTIGKSAITVGAMLGAGAYSLAHNIFSKKETFAWSDTFRWCKKNIWGKEPSAAEVEAVVKRKRLVLLRHLIDVVSSDGFIPTVSAMHGVSTSDMEKQATAEKIVQTFLNNWQREIEDIYVWCRKQSHRK